MVYGEAGILKQAGINLYIPLLLPLAYEGVNRMNAANSREDIMMPIIKIV